jgi:hypothetical protein
MVGVVHGACLDLGCWYASAFTSHNNTRKPFEPYDANIYVGTDPKDTWRILLKYPKCFGIRNYTHRDGDGYFIDTFLHGVVNELGCHVPIQADATLNLDYLPMFWWICAYLMIIRVGQDSFRPVIAIEKGFFGNLLRAQMDLFMNGFDMLLDLGLLLHQVTLAEIETILRKDVMSPSFN